MKKTSVLFLSALVLLFAANTCLFAQSSEESAGKVAEQAGKLREALNNYTTALQATSPGSEAEQRLLERAAAISSKVTPLPALPAEAERRLVRGQALVESARDADAFMRAAAEFRAALRAAPWLADAHYNLGIVLDKAQRFSEAIRSLKLSILAAPNAKEAAEAQRLIYRIEVRQEELQRAKAAAEQKAQAEAEMKPGKGQDLNGIWRRSEEKGWKVPQPDGEYVVSIIGTSIEIYNKQFARSDLYQGTVHGSLVKGVVVNRGWTGSPNGEFVAEISEDRRRIKILGTIGEPKLDNNGRVMRGFWDFKGVDLTLIR